MSELNLKEITFDRLKNLPLNKLLSLQEILNEAIEVRRETEKQDLLEKMTVLAAESGYSLNEIMNNKPKKSAVIKYRNPENFSESWTGRGRKPKWIKHLLDSGKKLDDFNIK